MQGDIDVLSNTETTELANSANVVTTYFVCFALKPNASLPFAQKRKQVGYTNIAIAIPIDIPSFTLRAEVQHQRNSKQYGNELLHYSVSLRQRTERPAVELAT